MLRTEHPLLVLNTVGPFVSTAAAEVVLRLLAQPTIAVGAFTPGVLFGTSLALGCGATLDLDPEES